MTVKKRTVIRNGRSYSILDEGPDKHGWSFWDAFQDHWESHIDPILERYLRPHNAFIDVGAWIGPISLIAARLCDHVYAFEPDPIAMLALQANVARQRRKNITVRGEALSADVDGGRIRIGHRDDREFGDSMTSTIFSGDAIEVPTVTMQTICARARSKIGLVKMDIEGGEETVLPAVAPFLAERGVPLLLSTHAQLVESPDRYLTSLDESLAGWSVEQLSGWREGLGTILATPQ